MKLSELIQEMVELIIKGEPEMSDYRSILDVQMSRERYREHLQELKDSIDDFTNNKETNEFKTRNTIPT